MEFQEKLLLRFTDLSRFFWEIWRHQKDILNLTDLYIVKYYTIPRHSYMVSFFSLQCQIDGITPQSAGLWKWYRHAGSRLLRLCRAPRCPRRWLLLCQLGRSHLRCVWRLWLFRYVSLGFHSRTIFYFCRVHNIFRFLVKVTKIRKNQLSFSGKMRIFYTENKQTGQLIFSHFCQVQIRLFWTYVWFVSFFVFLDQKRKNPLSCLFIFCIKNPHFAGKWQMIFSLFCHFDLKTKNETNQT